MNNEILVIGATGMLGKAVTEQLIKDKFDVSVFSTSRSKASKMFPTATIFEGDLRDVESVKRAIVGKDYIYMNLGIPTDAKKVDWNPEREGIKTVVEVAKMEQIKRIGYLSPKIANYGDWWVIQDKRRAVETIKSSGIPYYIFSASSFMDNFNGTQRDGKKINVVGKSNVKMFYISALDYAKQVSKAFSLENNKSKTYNIQGLDAYTIDDAAEIFVSNYSKEELKVAKAPMGLLKFIGLFNPTLKYVCKLMDALNNNPEPFNSQETWEELGKPTITLKEFAKL